MIGVSDSYCVEAVAGVRWKAGRDLARVAMLRPDASSSESWDGRIKLAGAVSSI